MMDDITTHVCIDDEEELFRIPKSRASFLCDKANDYYSKLSPTYRMDFLLSDIEKLHGVSIYEKLIIAVYIGVIMDVNNSWLNYIEYVIRYKIWYRILWWRK